jgi:hypothetical protein
MDRSRSSAQVFNGRLALPIGDLHLVARLGRFVKVFAVMPDNVPAVSLVHMLAVDGFNLAGVAACTVLGSLLSMAGAGCSWAF